MTESPDQQAVIEFLSRPQSYGEKGRVERIDTHAAIIFLCGAQAYKLKRDVAYSYLDFSTAAKRKAVCEAELSLNRRTAPELYLEVRSVNRRADGSLGFGEGEPVDWLVVMRRFDSDCLLEAVAARGELDDALVRDLADNIADFHDRAEVAPGRSGARRVRRVIEGNSDSMAALPAGSLPKDDCARLFERSMAALHEHGALLDERAASGHVRHCHGDLHLANVCLWRDRPTLFDCLEFDPELATTDLLYDLAFLVMDLWERGYRLQASLLFNRYLDMRDEGGGVAAFPLFLSMRAAVRAHVGATAAGRQNEASDRSAKLRAAQDYLGLALSFLDREDPCLVAVGGLSGTGKSTLARFLAPRIGRAPGARWLRSDVLRKRLAGVAPETCLTPEHYAVERNAEVYERLLCDAQGMLAAGQSVIVDGVFARPSERDDLAAMTRGMGVSFTGVWLEAPLEVLLERVAGRSGDVSDADRSLVEQQAEYELGDLSDWQRVNASGTVEATLTETSRLISHTSQVPEDTAKRIE